MPRCCSPASRSCCSCRDMAKPLSRRLRRRRWPSAGAAAPAASNVVLHVLLTLTAVLIAGRFLGALLRSVGQPPVIGEVLAGIILGPSLLGRMAPGLSAYILPPDVAPFLNVVAQLGVILYMFLVGLELNGELLQGRAHTTVAISHASIVAPFVLGCLLALQLYHALFDQRRVVHQFRPVHGRRDVDHGLSGAGAHPERSRHDQDAAWRHGAHLRGGGRCHGVVPAGAGRGRCAGADAGCVDRRGADARVHRDDVAGVRPLVSASWPDGAGVRRRSITSP